MDSWLIWVIAGVALLIWEMFTPGFVLGVFGLACFAGAVLAAWGQGATWQLAGFAAAVFFGFVFIRPIMLRFFFRDNPESRTGVEAMTGARGVVINSGVEPGRDARVRLGGEEWKAACPDGAELAVDAEVEVTGVKGATLLVRPVERGEES